MNRVDCDWLKLLRVEIRPRMEVGGGVDVSIRSRVIIILF